MSLHIMLLQFICICFVKALFLMKNNVVDENLEELEHIVKDHTVSSSVCCL